MMRTFTGLAIVVLLSAGVFGQSASNSAAFDAADIHVRAHSSNATPFMTGGVLRAGRYDLRNATMLDLIRVAYNVMDTDTILGGPSWLEMDRFDVIAKAPNATPPETLRIMLQNLLSDRFKLALHTVTKPQQGYALTVGSGGSKMTPAAGTGPSDCQPVPPGPPQPGVIPYIDVMCHNMTSTELAPLFRAFAGAYIGSPVADMTGLKGGFDFELKWTNRALLTQAGADGISFFDAVDKQLGLKLTPQMVSLPVLMVDSVNQKPTPNPSGVADSLPSPPPAEFDLATVKLSMPGAMPQGRIQPGGRIDLQGFTLHQLMSIAWDIPQNNNDLIANAPKFFDDTRYNVLAVTSTAVSGQGNQQQIDIDDLRLMLRALLTERFRIKLHTEDRPVSAYTLSASSKPKLTKADPASRTRWKEGGAKDTANDPRNTNPILARLVTVQNMTMAQFAQTLRAIAPGYVTIDVNDETGLDGSFDFTFNFTPIGLLQQGQAGKGADQSAGASAAASDPNGAMSLPEALDKQLGLKLDLRKRPVPVLVIDHIEEMPTDN